jgi:DNA (cytosine-5)-methyltransferase 1
MAVPFVKHILLQAPARSKTSRARHERRAQPRAPPKISLRRDIDLAVLRPENQNPTRVTPRIAKLAEGYFREEIMVVGGAPPPVDKAALERRQKKARRRLWELIELTRVKKMVSSNKINRVSMDYDCYTEVQVDGKIYRVCGFAMLVKDYLTSTFWPRLEMLFWFPATRKCP